MGPEFSLDQLVRLFGAASDDFLFRGVAVAISLFVLLATIQIAWDLLMWVLRDEPNIFGLAVRRFLLLSFYYTLILALPLWLPFLLNGFESLGQLVTGIDGLSPSSVVEQGVGLAFSVFNAWTPILALIDPFPVAMQILTFWIVLVAFVVIALQLTRVLIESTLVLGGLVVFLATAAHRATFSIFEGYVRYLFEVGVRLFVVYLMVGVGHNLGQQWEVILFTRLAGNELGPLLLPITAACWAYLVWSLPNKIAQALTGSFSLAGHNPLADHA